MPHNLQLEDQLIRETFRLLDSVNPKVSSTFSALLPPHSLLNFRLTHRILASQSSPLDLSEASSQPTSSSCISDRQQGEETMYNLQPQSFAKNKEQN